MDREKKNKIVSSVKDDMESSASVIVVHNTGLTVSEISEFRRGLRDVGATCKVLKNTLIRLALLKTSHSDLVEVIKGPVALVFSNDILKASKVVTDYSKKNEKLLIVAGSASRGIMESSDIKYMASLPPLDEIRAKLLATLNHSATRVVQTIVAPARQLTGVFCSYSKK